MSDAQRLAERVVSGMMARDAFSQWLGIEVLTVKPEESAVRMTVRPEMVNGFGIAHGGIAFSFADSALAFASNAYGRLSVALDCAINFSVAVKVGDELTCEAKEFSLTNKTGTYLIDVMNQRNEKVAFFKGTVYRTSKEYEV